MTKKRLHALHVAGIGSSKPSGVAFYLDGGHQNLPPTNYDLVPGLVAYPGDVTDQWDLGEGRFSTSGRSFELDWRQMSYFFSRQKRATKALASAVVTSSTTTIGLATAGLGGLVVHVGDEAILLGTHTGSEYIGCTRGYYGTLAQPHDAGAAVFERLPTLDRRLLTYLVIDVGTGSTVYAWQGVARADRSSPISTTARGTRLVLPAASRWEVGLQGWAGGSADLNAGRALERTEDGRVQGVLRQADGAASAPALIEDTSINRTVVVELEGALVDIGWQATTEQMRVVARRGELLAFGTRLEDGDPGRLDAPVYELVAWERAEGLIPAGATSYHPVDVAMAMLRVEDGGTPAAPLSLAGALPLPLAGWTAWETTRDEMPGLEIDQLVLGAGGQTWLPLERALASLLWPHGLLPDHSAQGEVVLRRVRTLDLKAFDGAARAQPFHDGAWARGDLPGYDEVLARIGETPTSAPAETRVTVPGVSRTRARTTGLSSAELDLRVYYTSRLRELVAELAAHALLVALELPVLTCTVPAPTSTEQYALGAWVRLEGVELRNAWWIDTSGMAQVFADIEDSAAMCGMVIARTYHVESGSYTLKLLMVHHDLTGFSRERAPSAAIASVTSGTLTLTLDTGTFGFPAGDGLSFEVGDEIRIWLRNGTEWSVSAGVAAKVVTSRSATTLVVNSWWASDPPAGSYVRLGRSHEYANTARYASTTRPYVFAANSDGELEHDGAVEGGDPWAGGWGVA